MGGFIDPFLPSLAWPQDNAFTGSSWTDTSVFPLDPSLADSSGTYKGTAPAEDVQFHGQNGSSPVLMNGGSKQVMDKSLFPGETMSPVKLHEQVLQQDDRTQDLNFELDSAIECALMAGSLGPTLSTSCPISLTESPLVLCTSNESSGSDQFLMGEQSISSASAMWPSTYANIPSLVGEQTLQTFGFGRIPGDDLLNEACTPNVKKYPQIGSVPSASLPLHDDTEFNTSQPLSFAPGQQMTLNNADFHINQKEFSGLHHLDLFSLVSSFNGIGTAQNPKQCTEATSGRHDMISLFGTPPEVQNGDGTGGNGATKPRVRARRGQATDPHSIAERLRREKISDRMKNLQELVPNSNKTDKASMLDEIIEYVKFLQLQVKVLSMSRLGATEAVVPLLTESPNESCGLLISPRSGRQTGGLTQTDLQDSSAFEQEVVQLMENNMTTAMEYLQSKGLCLMPIALATAISNQKGTSSAAIPPKSGTGAQPETRAAEEGITGCSKADVKKVDALKPLNSPRGTKSRA